MTVTSSCSQGSRNPLVRLSNTRGVIQTRDGITYQYNQDCRWNLSSNAMLKLQFARFSTYSSADYLTVYDGDSPSAHLIGRFSGRSLPAPITSSSNKLYVQFTSDGSGSTYGFKAWYRGMMLYITKHSMVESGLKEARNSFFGLGVYLLKSKFRIEDKLRFP